MKPVLIFLVLLIHIPQISAEVFTRYLEINKPSIIEILEREKLHINKQCFDNFVECTKFLKKKANSKPIIKRNFKYIGHPSSDFCLSSKGHSEIFIDKSNNQYDYCSFNETFIIDSWDFYNRYKK